MKENNQDNRLNTVALNVKRALSKDGILLSSKNPFYHWIHGEQVTFCNPEELGLSFYIANPPVPKMAPYDFAMVFISFENPDMGGIYFQLTFCFHAALEPCVEVDEIEAVYGQHDSIWFTKLADYFGDIEGSFNLTWDTEYDESIEDNLAGWIPLEKVETILEIMKKLQDQHENWLQQEIANKR